VGFSINGGGKDVPDTRILLATGICCPLLGAVIFTAGRFVGGGGDGTAYETPMTKDEVKRRTDVSVTNPSIEVERSRFFILECSSIPNIALYYLKLDHYKS
jgi:hypothetical protein